MAIPENHKIHAALDEVSAATAPAWERYARRIVANVGPDESYSLSNYLRLAGLNEVSHDFFAAIFFLSSCREAVLDVKLFIYTQDGARSDLNQEQMNMALRGIPMEHPCTGEMLEEPAKHVFFAYDLLPDAFDPADPREECNP